MLFWAETSGSQPPKGRRSAGAEPAGRARPQSHPFAATPESVADLLVRLQRSEDVEAGTPLQNGKSVMGAHVGLTPLASQGGLQATSHELIASHAGTAALWLPGTRQGPQPSPQLLHEWTLEAGEVDLSTWEIRGILLPARDAFAILAALPLEGDPLPDIAVGADARYWHAVTSVVLEVLASQTLAPVLVGTTSERGKRVYHARWLAVLDSPQDAARLSRLEAAMPPVCRAGAGPAKEAADRRSRSPGPGQGGASPQEAGQPDGPSPRALLDSFVKAMVDALARNWALAVFDRAAAAQLPGAVGLATRLGGIEGAAGRWFRALFGPDSRLDASAAQLQALDRSVQAWLRNLQVAGAGDFRVAFRLSPPPAREVDLAGVLPEANGNAEGSERASARMLPGGTWHLDYLLQARNDPSLMMPAEEVWQARGAALQHLGRRMERPQERLLAALGYAGRFFPPMLRSLKTSRPQELELSADEAFQFLREAAPLLEQSGFGVLVPPWWNQRGSRLGLRLKARPKGKGSDQVAGQPESRAAGRVRMGTGDRRHHVDPCGVRGPGGHQVAAGAGARPVGAAGPRSDRSRAALLSNPSNGKGRRACWARLPVGRWRPVRLQRGCRSRRWRLKVG